MQVIKFSTDKNQYEFFCECNANRHGFTHTAKMFKNGQNITASRVHYINRTWEPWDYYSAINCCIDSLEDARKTALLEEFKIVNNYTRVTAKRRAEFEKSIEGDPELKEYKRLRNQVKIK